MGEHLSRGCRGCEYFKIFIFVCLMNLLKHGNSQQLRNNERINFDGYQVFRIVPMTYAQLNILKSLAYSDHDTNFDFWKVPTIVDEPVDIMISPEKVTDLERLLAVNRIPKSVEISDVGRFIRNERAGFSSTNTFSTDNLTFFADYRGIDEIYNHIDKLTAKYQHIATTISIGKSGNGRDLKVIKIGDKLQNSTKPGIWIDGGIHAREWVSISTAIYIATKLTEDYDKDKGVKELIDTYNWYILPALNPDGYEYSRTTNRLWRKNLRKAVSSMRNCVGVDLNRNWDFHWAETVAIFNPCHELYVGPRAFSEPETIAVAKFILQKKDNMKAYLTLHAYGQFWFTPWGYTRNLPINYDSLVAVAREATNALTNVHGTRYEVGSSARIMYIAPGGSDDWAFGVAKINYSYTIELRPIDKYGFLLPPRFIIPTGEETFAGVKALSKAIKREL